MTTSNIALCFGFVALSGCQSNSPSAPSATPVAVSTAAPVPSAPPMVIATLPPPTVTPSPLTPSPIVADSLAAPTILPTPDVQAQNDRDNAKRQEIMRLRGEIRDLERQKASEQSKRDEMRSQRLEREKKSGFSSAPGSIEYAASLTIDNLDNQIMAKQREIDSVMMQR